METLALTSNLQFCAQLHLWTQFFFWFRFLLLFCSPELKTYWDFLIAHFPLSVFFCKLCKLQTFHIFIRTIWSILIKLAFQGNMFKKRTIILFKIGHHSEILLVEILTTFNNLFQNCACKRSIYQRHLTQNIFEWRKFKLVQIKGHSMFENPDNGFIYWCNCSFVHVRLFQEMFLRWAIGLIGPLLRYE